MKRLSLLAFLCLLVAAPAAADDIDGRKRSVDEKIARLREQAAAAHAREQALRGEVGALDGQIRSLERQSGDVSAQLATLERDLGLQRRRAATVNELYALRTRRLRFLRRQQAVTRKRLERRLVDIYEADHVEDVEVFLSASSFSELLDRYDYMNEIAAQDRRIAREVSSARAGTARARSQTAQARRRVAGLMQAVAVRAEQVRRVRDELDAQQSGLANARADRKRSLATLSASERAAAEEIDSLEAESAELAARIRAAAAQAPPGQAPTSSGGAFAWPVAGTVTSSFGQRWGRMHEGLDIAAGSGTPIRAAGSGRVIYAGWMGGYGNLVVIDHGNGLSTAYAHQSALAAAVGQSVSQGQTIGYVGSTGNSTGPHLHFEVRSGGSAVDPLGYL